LVGLYSRIIEDIKYIEYFLFQGNVIFINICTLKTKPLFSVFQKKKSLIDFELKKNRKTISKDI